MRNLVMAVIFTRVLSRLATSYIDPNTGGMLFQMLAVLFGLLSGALLFFSSQIRMIFARLKRRIRGEDEPTPATTVDSNDQ